MLTIWTNGTDFVIAESLEDAMLVCHETSGEPIEDIQEYWADNQSEFKSYPLNEEFSIIPDWDNYWEQPTLRETHTVGEWIALKGRGYLACTEY